jgi:hypothetical protein
MSAVDHCQAQIKRALEKEGWVIDPRPYTLETEDSVVYIDLEAKRPTNGYTESLLLAEVKCFTNPKKNMPDLYGALGQYLLYRKLLHRQGIYIPLYLARPEEAYRRLFKEAVMELLTEHRINLVIVALETERISRWITPPL